jgi:hypothetical protein
MFDYTRDLYKDFSEAEKSKLLAGLKKLFAQLTVDSTPDGHADHLAGPHS